jgi:hypothetical protein
MPDTNIEAFNDFIDNVLIVAKEFNNAAIIIRMKSLEDKDIKYIMRRLNGFHNIFLSVDYKNSYISYSLSKEADLIISVPTSLAEESIVYGKKVIFINNLYPIDDISINTYSEDFHFCIARDFNNTIDLIHKCLGNDYDLSCKYNDLKDKLLGNLDLTKTEAISSNLEEFLQ